MKPKTISNSTLVRKVQVWIYAENKGVFSFLLFKTNEKRGGFWQPVTGGVNEGESYDAAALREASEESGLKLESKPFLIGFEFDFESNRGQKKSPAHEICYAISVDWNQRASVMIDPKEHSESLWVSAEEVLSKVKFESNQSAFKLLSKKLSAE
jgi:dihydroneopterin triphosphate diphosphatase